MAKRELEISTQTDWRSLYVLAVIAFLGALKIGTGEMERFSGHKRSF